jgi:hypothetical protein
VAKVTRFADGDASQLVDFYERKLAKHAVFLAFFGSYDGVYVGPAFDPKAHGLKGKAGREARDDLGYVYLAKATMSGSHLRLTVHPPKGVDGNEAAARLTAAGLVDPPPEPKSAQVQFAFPKDAPAQTVVDVAMGVLRTLSPSGVTSGWEFRPDKSVDASTD